jgi:hypothetical protein
MSLCETFEIHKIILRWIFGSNQILLKFLTSSCSPRNECKLAFIYVEVLNKFNIKDIYGHIITNLGIKNPFRGRKDGEVIDGAEVPYL